MKKVILAAAFVLTGCAAGPKNIEALKDRNYVDHFPVELSYQTTYRNFKNAFSQCGGLNPSWLKPVSVDTDLFTDLHEGRIILNLVPSVGAQKPIRLIQINQAGNNSSEVTIYHTGQYELDHSKAIYRQWANGEVVCE